LRRTNQNTHSAVLGGCLLAGITGWSLVAAFHEIAPGKPVLQLLLTLSNPKRVWEAVGMTCLALSVQRLGVRWLSALVLDGGERSWCRCCILQLCHERSLSEAGICASIRCFVDGWYLAAK